MRNISSYKDFKMLREELNVGDMWDEIPNSIKDLYELFKLSGKSLYVVGGSVRDFLNKESPKDFDLCTDATPDEILKIIDEKYRTTLQGKSFFVVVVYTEDQPKGMEIATFREDVYGELLGITRNPEVRFSTIDKDVERRDIPYNALFYDLDQRKIIDLVNGIEDLKNGITRFVGDPNMRILEDPLRILRVFRFSCRYDFRIEEKSAEAIKNNREKLSIITTERIWEEIKKAYGQISDFSLYLKYLRDFAILEIIYPDIEINEDIKKCDFLEVYFSNLFKNNDANISKFQEKITEKYKISTEISRVVCFLISFQYLDLDNFLVLYDRKKSLGINEKEKERLDLIIEDWIKVAALHEYKFSRFLIFKRSVNVNKLMTDTGLRGKELGDEIKRIETEKFKDL